jgi:hypothetical protein
LHDCADVLAGRASSPYHRARDARENQGRRSDLPLESAPSTRMSKRSLAILLVLLVVARACLVLSLSDVFFYGEELGKGAAAKAMLDGLGVEHYKLSYGYHEGGGFVVTHLKALAFLLVGENVLAHKLVALFMTSILLLVGLWFTGEHFGRRAGWIFGLLFVCAPAAFQRCSLIDVGTHFEAMIFIVLILHFAFRIAFPPWKSGAAAAPSSVPGMHRRALDHIGLGLSAGFGIYFSLQCAPAIACAVVCVIAAERSAIFRRATAIAIAAFAIGAWPLWWMMSHVGLAALIVRGHDFGRGTSVIDGLRGLFAPLRGSVVEACALALYAVVIGWGLWRLSKSSRARRAIEPGRSLDSFTARDSTKAAGAGSPDAAARDTAVGAWERLDRALASRKALVLLAYIALFVALYLTSGLAIEYRGHWFFFLRLTAVWFMGIVLFAAVSLVACRDGSNALPPAPPLFRGLYFGALTLLLLAGLLDVFDVMGEGRPGEMARNARLLATTKGYDYSEYLDKFVNHLDAPEEQKIAVLLRYRDDPELLWPSIDHSMFEHSQLPLQDVLDISRRSFGEGWVASLKGLGPYLFTTNGFSLDNEFARILEAPAETQEVLAEAIGRTGKGLKIDLEHIEKEIRASVPPQWRQAFLRGTGWRIHKINRLHPERALEFIAQQSAEDQVPLRAGYDAAVAMNTLK